jgi:hypothetical protein
MRTRAAGRPRAVFLSLRPQDAPPSAFGGPAARAIVVADEAWGCASDRGGASLERKELDDFPGSRDARDERRRAA